MNEIDVATVGQPNPVSTPDATAAAGGQPWSEPTPIPVTPRVRTLIVVAALVAAAWLVWAAPIVPRLLLTGAALALVLSFPVRLLSRLLPRAVAIVLVVLAAILLLIALLVLIPVVIVQLTELIAQAPTYIDEAEALLLRGLQELAERGLLTDEPEQVIVQIRQGLVDRAQGAAEQVLAGLLNGLTGALGALIQLFGVLFVAVYLLADIGRFRAALLRSTPTRYRDDVESLWQQLAHSLSRYLGGLLISILVQGALATVVLWLLDVPYALLLGLWTAGTAVLPYVGAFLGGIPAVLIALFVSPTTALLTALAYLAINQIEGNLLTPRIQGEAVRVHPLLIFLAVVAGSEVGGLLGAALAVPALAVLRVLVDFFGDRVYVPRRVAPAPEHGPLQPLSAHAAAEPFDAVAGRPD